MPAPDDEVTIRAQARLGTFLREKYRLDHVLGVGGMASVYSATHRNSKRFAVKMLHPELSLRSDIRTRFLREGYVANQVQHPGVVIVLDDDVTEDGTAFLVMELLEGMTVEGLWERHANRLPLAAVLAVGQQVLDVLASAHARGIVHRDIKPANLFLTSAGQIKVLDFGIARLRDVAANSATNTGALMGTPAFMSPEQALGKTSEIDAQSDIWAVGAVLFTLASGRYLHEGESAQHILVQTATTPAASFATVMPGAPREVVQLIDSALAFEKANRWASAAAMRNALSAATQATYGAASPRRALIDLLGASEVSAAVAMAELEAADAHAATTGVDSSLSEERTRIHVPKDREGYVPKAMARPATRHAGLSTEQPVFRDGAKTTSRAHRGVWFAAGGLGLVGLMATGVLLLGGSDRRPPPMAAAAATAAPAVPSVVASTATPVATLKAIEEPASVAIDRLPRAPSPIRVQPTATAPPQAGAPPTAAPSPPAASAIPLPPASATSPDPPEPRPKAVPERDPLAP